MLSKLAERAITAAIPKVIAYFNPRVELEFHEFTEEDPRSKSRSKAYICIEAYLAERATRLSAQVNPGIPMVFSFSSMDDCEVSDDFEGANFEWTKVVSASSSSGERRYFIVNFHPRHRELAAGAYLSHVLEEGQGILARRQRKLYHNKRSKWAEGVFEHPASFETVAMDPSKKNEIVEDLITFRDSKEYYATIGKVWKRGYLLHGPPGTGKSTMIGAMANFLQYNVYHLELAAVKSNQELRDLLLDTSGKSIIVVENIDDCSVDLTGPRKKGSQTKEERESVTLSGLLSCIDGIWSATGGDGKLIIFTANDKEKLDPALIRPGRMDKHVYMPYCNYAIFKVLATNNLGLEWHPLFDPISTLLGEVDITPAFVAECLMPKTRLIAAPVSGEIEIEAEAETAGKEEACLHKLIEALNLSKKEKEEAEAAKNEVIEALKAMKEEEDIEKLNRSRSFGRCRFCRNDGDGI